jgi:hypothetical protein
MRCRAIDISITFLLFKIIYMKKFMILMIAALTISSVSVLAQEKAGKKDTTQHTVLYTCSMHPDVTSEKPIKCSKCGMDLSLSKKEEMKKEVTKSYQCPVHLDVISEQPGKCSKCNKKLSLSKKEEMKTEVMKQYTCPMHSDLVSDKPGKCSKCGMDLTVKKGSQKKNK